MFLAIFTALIALYGAVFRALDNYSGRMGGRAGWLVACGAYSSRCTRTWACASSISDAHASEPRASGPHPLPVRAGFGSFLTLLAMAYPIVMMLLLLTRSSERHRAV